MCSDLSTEKYTKDFFAMDARLNSGEKTSHVWMPNTRKELMQPP